MGGGIGMDVGVSVGVGEVVGGAVGKTVGEVVGEVVGEAVGAPAIHRASSEPLQHRQARLTTINVLSCISGCRPHSFCIQMRRSCRKPVSSGSGQADAPAREHAQLTLHHVELDSHCHKSTERSPGQAPIKSLHTDATGLPEGGRERKCECADHRGENITKVPSLKETKIAQM